MSLRIAVLTHQDLEIPESLDGIPEQEIVEWRTEYDVLCALERLGHETRVLGGFEELPDLRRRLDRWKPHVVFNLMEEFRGRGIYVPYVLGWLRLRRQPFTGCNPSSLLLVDDKPLMKKILRYHRIPIPDFALFPRGRRVRRPARLDFPLIVKSATIHGSVGIAQASVVTTDAKLAERVEFVHDKLGTDALAEQFVEGRELYLGMLGNRRLETFPIWEIDFGGLPEGAPRIATEKMKWDVGYQKRIGLGTGAARGLPEGAAERIGKLCKRVYRILGLNGYARMDLRLSPDGSIHLLEPNPNPDLAIDEDFSESAHAAGIEYDRLVQRVINLGLRRFAPGGDA